MNTSLSFHNVAKIQITPTGEMQSSNGRGSFNSREIIVTFDDGTSVQIDFFNRNETLPLEIN